MDRSSGFGSTTCYFTRFLHSLSLRLPQLYCLTSQHIVTRRPVLQKVRHHTRVVLCLLVSTRFQVLFHSPPGVLFTFPSRYYTLSVTWSYLAFGDGPPFFRQDSSCPDVLRLRLAFFRFRVRGCYPLSLSFPEHSANFFLLFAVPKPLIYFYIKFGLFRFRSPLLSESIFLSFPPGNEMFQFPGFPTYNYLFIIRYRNITCSEFPHSDICGSTLICSSPQLFAACHVLLRRHIPRHPPVCSL